MCNAFLVQLTWARQAIAGGDARYGLIIQSSAMSRLMRQEDQFSAWFGDGATAVVVGPVSEGSGVLGSGHRTDGSVFGGIVTGIPGRRWYEEGRTLGYLEEPAKARKMILSTADVGVAALDDALDRAGVTRGEVGFYASHQPTCWFRRVTQQVL